MTAGGADLRGVEPIPLQHSTGSAVIFFQILGLSSKKL
jgi:hypothetical protein